MYLSSNSKTKNIVNSLQVNLIVDHIMNDCSNLEMQEIEFIFRSGVIGKFGTIYGEITIDTITGLDGWIETYYKSYRNKRAENLMSDHDPEYNGNEISAEEFLKLNPEYMKLKSDLKELYDNAISGKIDHEQVKKFYLLKDMTIDDYDVDRCFLGNEFDQIHDDIERMQDDINLMISHIAEIENKISIENVATITKMNIDLEKNIKLLNQTKLHLRSGKDIYVLMKFTKFIKDNIYNINPNK